MYVAIIGDIKNSRELTNRDEVQIKLKQILTDINDKYSEQLAADFLITIGDEFQGLLNSPECLLAIIKHIQLSMMPVEIRFGIGIGDITTELNTYALGIDGPAFYAAREMINYVHEHEKKKKYNIRVAFYRTDGPHDEMWIRVLNTLLLSLTLIEEAWSSRTREIMADILLNEETYSQTEIANRLEINQSTVARGLQSANYQGYREISAMIEELIRSRSRFL